MQLHLTIDNRVVVACSVAMVAGSAVIIGYKTFGKLSSWWRLGHYPDNSTVLSRLVSRPMLDLSRTNIMLENSPHTASVRVRKTDNGHKVSGAVRDAAKVSIHGWASENGWSTYEISPYKGNGYVSHVAPGDLGLPARNDKVGDNDAIVCIDTDYYVDNWDDLLGIGRPVCLFTFNPIKVAGLDGDCHFRIKDNCVTYDVSGGASWVHKVWDWTSCGEFLAAWEPVRYMSWARWFVSFLGFRRKVWQKVAFSRPWDECPDRAIVWTIPQYRAWQHVLLPDAVHARRLDRNDYKSSLRKGWNAIVRPNVDKKLVMSIGPEGEDIEMTLPKADHDVLMGLTTCQSVTTRMLGLNNDGRKYGTVELALMGQYFTGAVRGQPEHLRLAHGSNLTVHWPLASFDDEPNVSFRPISGPLVPDCNAVPAIKRWETLSRSIDERVTFQRNDVVPPSDVWVLAEEFATLVVPQPHQGTPLSWQDCIDEMTKPSQVLAISRVLETLDFKPREMIEAFVKNEPVHKNARIISSFPDARYLLALSRFTLAMRDENLHAEHNSHWFMPGNAPRAMAEKVCAYIASIHTPAEGDFTNLDGTVSAWLQTNVGMAIYLRWVHPEYRAELSDLLKTLISCPSRAKRFGFKYESGPGVKSGSPTTCDINSLYTAFTMYCAIRRTLPFVSKECAFANLGLAFGDDSLFDQQYKKGWNWIVDKVGLKIKIEKFDPTQGVTFLARVYPDPLTTTTSFQDPLRTMRKLHLTSRDRLVPIADAALDRLSGYLLSDKLTPIIGNYCATMTKVYTRSASSLEVRQKRADHNKDKPYWLVTGEAWPQDVKDVPLMRACVAARVGVSEEVLAKFCGLLDSYDGVGDVPCLDHGDFKPLQDSLEADGLPCSEPVDQRKHNQDVQQISSRIPPECQGQGRKHFRTFRDGEDKCKDDNLSNQRLASPTSGGGKRGVQSGKRNCRPTRQANVERPPGQTDKLRSGGKQSFEKFVNGRSNGKGSVKSVCRIDGT